MMRIGLAIDAACDLPQAFLAKHAVTVMPITVKVDHDTFLDDRDEAEIRRFIARKLGSRSHQAETVPCSVEQVQQLFLDQLVLKHDCVFCLTITASRSPINQHVQQASFAILQNYRSRREPAGITGPFMMRVVDTRNLFAGGAPVVWEAARLIADGQSPAVIRERLVQLAEHAHGYLLPRDLYYLRARAKKKNDRSVGLVSAMVGSALDIKPIVHGYRGDTGPVGKARGFEAGAGMLFQRMAEKVRSGELLAPVLCLSYGGDLAELAALPGHDLLCEACIDCGVELLEAPMGITGMVNVGEGALTLGFLAEQGLGEF